MKHLSCLFLAAIILVLPVFAAATTAPANPMEQSETGDTSSALAADQASGGETAEPQNEEASSELEDDILSEEMIAQLDEEAMEYLTGEREPIAAVDGIRNILLVGVDARPGETRSRSDTMVILTLDGNKNEIRMTSIMRDLYVKIPGKNNNRINTAWVYGGPQLLLDTIEENLGLKIEEYVSVDLTVLIDVIDQLGGLTLTVESEKQLGAINGVIYAYNYQFNEPEDDGLLTKLGEQHMNGKQVQAYARYRKIDSDVQRTARQREVLSLLFEELQTKSLIELTRIASSVLDKVETNLSFSDIVSLIPVLYGMKDAEISQMNIPYDVDYHNKTVSGMSVLVADMDLCQNALEKFVNGKK